MEGDKNRSLFLSPADGKRQEPFSLLIPNRWEATRTGLFSYRQQKKGNKNRSLFLSPTDGRRHELVFLLIANGWKAQEPVSLLIANEWKAIRINLSSFCQRMEGDKNWSEWSLFFLPTNGRRQERVSLLIANGWKVTKTGYRPKHSE
jgi:hypothetical protein